LEEGHPGAGVGVEHGGLHLGMSLVQEVEGLRESTQHNAVDNAEGEHVTRDHGVDHGHKGTRQPNGTKMVGIQMPSRGT